MVAYKKPQQRKKEETEKLRGERERERALRERERETLREISLCLLILDLKEGK